MTVTATSRSEARGPRYLAIGELTVDDVVVEGEECDWQQAGGGGLYSAVGAFVWSGAVGLSSVVGTDYPGELRQQIADAGLDLRGVTTSAEINSIGLWLLYERDGTRRQVEKRRGGTFAEVDLHRTSPFEHGLAPVAVHIAPQSSRGQQKAVEVLRGRGVLTTMDVLIEPSIDREPYLDGAVFSDLDAFLPSEQEVVDLWGHCDVVRLGRWLRAHGSDATTVIKRGGRGVEVLTPDGVVGVPSAVEELVDPTGAGDAFCGGFLVGLAETGDPVEAAVRGAVSASFVCETRGALAAMRRIDPDVAHLRAERVRQLLKEVK